MTKALATSVLVSLIDTGKTNARPESDYTSPEQKQLEASISGVGLAQPVLLRPKGARFELVAGERRLRAFKKLGLKEIPAYVRELTDEEAIALQTVENKDRKDLTPLQEATYYRMMAIKLKIPTTEIAARVGESATYVLRRMKLLDLDEKVLAKLKREGIALSVAEELTRITDAKRQMEALEEMGWRARVDGGDVAGCKKIIAKYLLVLADAPFNIDDAKLVAGCGACAACPKRSGAQGALFAGVEKTDLCLDAVCYGKKEDAHFGAILDKYKKEGRKVLTREETKKAVNDDRLVLTSAKDSHLKSNKSFKQGIAASKVKPEVIIGINTEGHVAEYVDPAKARANYPPSILESYYKDQAKSKGNKTTEKEQAKQAAERRRVILDNKAGAAAWPKLWKATIDKLATGKPWTVKELRDFLVVLLGHHTNYHMVKGLQERMGIKGSSAMTHNQGVTKAVAAMKDFKQVQAVALHLLIANGQGYKAADLMPCAEEVVKLAGLDWKQAKAVEAKRITAERADKVNAKKEKK